METIKLYGQILDMLDESYETTDVLVCIGEPGYVEARRFDPRLFEGLGLEVNDHVLITMTTEPGRSTLQVEKTTDDVAHLFVKIDFFKDMGDLSWLNDPDPEEKQQ